MSDGMYRNLLAAPDMPRCECHDCTQARKQLGQIEKEVRASERERCAKIAEEDGVYPELNVACGGPDWYRHGRHIAKRIREGK